MSYVIVAPETMTAAATDLAGIGSALGEAHTAAAPPTVALVPAAADEVSAGVAHLFSRYAEDFHRLARKAAAFQEQFVGHLSAGAGSYARAEAANVAPLHALTASAGSIGSTAALPSESRMPQTLSNIPLVNVLEYFLHNIVTGNTIFAQFISWLVASYPPWDLLLILLTAPVSLPYLFFWYIVSLFFNA